MQSLIQKREWKLRQLPSDRVFQIATDLNCSTGLAKVLASRSIESPGQFLRFGLESLNPPSLLAGLDRAVARIDQAIRANERIFIQGDFDVDGITSSAILFRALRKLGHTAEIHVELSDRQRGHGLNESGIRKISAENFKLLITTDCGISEVEPIRELQQRGVDVIITDHHQPPAELPPAHAIVNPKLSHCPYPNKDLAAVGVVFQLVRALYPALGLPAHSADEFLDLVMLGTIGDLVPLVRKGNTENRVLVSEGLKRIACGEGCTGLRVLIDRLGLEAKRLTSGEVGFVIVPKLNAANRVGDPRVAFLLLTTPDKKLAEYRAEILLDYNDDRQIAQDDLVGQAEELIRAEVNLEKDKIIIISGQYWNPGIIGLVASDIADRYSLPTILISRDDRVSRGSGRSIHQFDLMAALESVKELFERYGGHQMAAGFSIRNENIPPMKERLKTYAHQSLSEWKGPTYEIDCRLEPNEISLDLHQELQRLGPFGMGNPTPKFLLSQVKIAEAQAVGNGRKHLRMKVRAGDRLFNCIGFDLGDFLEQVYRAQQVDLVFKLQRNEWMGVVQAQLELEDVLSPELS
ncbi:single-stranded-DNA-specific exonuclease RecJ [Candidatus Acetothermia bacterium]|nr:single-stranded-DNA-specific exonuclease RecJ [Candidatus Acetothermia bacterium]MBI3461170.1 single-stranded-DNA-specific exonuclease RecJ [Candidatus Acetothermia bacterium]